MKKIICLFWLRIAGLEIMFLAIAIISISGIPDPKKQSITGKLIDLKSNLTLPYASVSLIKPSDSTLVTAAMSDTNGVFNLGAVPRGDYNLVVSLIGYQKVSKTIAVSDQQETFAGVIYLQDQVFNLNETTIIGDRLKGKSENGKTTFFVTKKMVAVSNNGTDILKLIPGIQLDIMQNISVQGSQNILILVDGKERDKSFISQLMPKQIDKVEVFSAPPPNYDGNATAAINIILKKDVDSGFSGQVNAEIPTSASEVYIFPTYSFNYGFKKMNFYTSYNGEIAYFDVHERSLRKILNSPAGNTVTSDQFVRQRDWSHRFHYGFDYFLSPHDQFNFYAFYNPYSNEHNGNAAAQFSGSTNNNWEATKLELDKNTSTFYSMYYKHLFDKAGQELTVDLSNYYLKAENKANFIFEGPGNRPDTIFNAVKPNLNATSIKIDLTLPISGKLNFSSGVKGKFQRLMDEYSTDFVYHENIVAAYGKVTFKTAKYDWNAGLRAEKSVATLKNNFTNPVVSFLPYAMFRYSLTTGQYINFSYNRTISRPTIFQLNPYTTISDPYSVSKGNPYLNPEFRNSLSVEHSIQFGSNYIATRLFYNQSTDVLNNLTFINDTNAFVTQWQNLGAIHQYGVQFLGSLKLGIATLNPYLRLFDTYTVSNRFGKQNGVNNRLNHDFESGLSAILSFKHDLSLTFVFQYATPGNYVQGNSYSDALYFLSIEKTFKQRLKIGIVSIIPFTKSFIYQGSDLHSSNFSMHNQGNIKMSAFPISFKISYQFIWGKNRDQISRAKEEIESAPKKGF